MTLQEPRDGARFVIKGSRDWRTVDGDGHGVVIFDNARSDTFLVVGSASYCKMVLDALNAQER